MVIVPCAKSTPVELHHLPKPPGTLGTDAPDLLSGNKMLMCKDGT